MVRKYINIPVLFLPLKKKKQPKLSLFNLRVFCFCGSQPFRGHFIFQGTFGIVWRYFLIATTQGRVQGLLPTILQQLGQPPQQRVIWPHISIGMSLVRSLLSSPRCLKSWVISLSLPSFLFSSISLALPSSPLFSFLSQ